MEDFTLVIFGITSNLAQIKLIPAIYDMEEKGLLPDNMRIIGVARGAKSQDEIKDYFHEVLHQENRHHKHDIKEDIFKKLAGKLHYIAGDVGDVSFYQTLKKTLLECPSKNTIFYLATYPELYQSIFGSLQTSGLNKQDRGWVRLMIEKPIGSDLESARKLNDLLHKYFAENQIFRLDHYLGKETLQNILTFRFGNGIFEPLINNHYIDHIQITAAEDFGIGGRGGYYDKVGALRDVGQNHQLQMIAFALMEAPSEFSNEAVTEERIKILEKLVPKPDSLVLGQYEGYKNEKNVAEGSKTDTFYAFTTEVDSERYRGVPIYVRAGKKMAQTVTEIAIVFKNPVNRLFTHLECGREPNVLIYRIQPNEGIVFKILTKKPGADAELAPEYMQFCYKQTDGSHYLPDPYERLLLDAIRGDQTFFNDSKEVEAEWKFVDSIRLSFDKLRIAQDKVHFYKLGSWGPKEADDLLEGDDRCWLEPSMEFCRI